MVLKMSQVTLCLCCVFLLFCDLVVFHGFLSYSLVLQRFSSPQVLSLCLPCVPCVLASMFVYFLFYFDSPLRQCILFCFLTVSSRLIMFSCVPCLCVFSSVPCQFVCVSSVFPCLSFLVPGFCMFSVSHVVLVSFSQFRFRQCFSVPPFIHCFEVFATK